MFYRERGALKELLRLKAIMLASHNLKLIINNCVNLEAEVWA
ncbi:MAG: hypothetical protein AABX17_04180 [Nanoarchaeota archaeon]